MIVARIISLPGHTDGSIGINADDKHLIVLCHNFSSYKNTTGQKRLVVFHDTFSLISQ